MSVTTRKRQRKNVGGGAIATLSGCLYRLTRRHDDFADVSHVSSSSFLPPRQMMVSLLTHLMVDDAVQSTEEDDHETKQSPNNSSLPSIIIIAVILWWFIWPSRSKQAKLYHFHHRRLSSDGVEFLPSILIRMENDDLSPSSSSYTDSNMQAARSCRTTSSP